MIRQFHAEDASACCALIQGCLADDPSYSPALLRRIRMQETPQALAAQARLFYISVYEEDDKILGIGGLDLNEIRLLYVSTGHRHRGIGRDLLEHLIAMVPCALFRDVFVYSAQPAVAFYRACGFEDKGQFVFDLEGEQLETVFMTLPLPAAPRRELA